MKKYIATGMLIGLVTIWLVVSFQGCGSELATGVAIGAGTSGAVAEAQSLAEKSKAELIAQIVALKSELEEATDPAEVIALQKRIATLEKQETIIGITESVTSKIQEGLGRDWTTKEPEKQEANIRWAIEAALVGLFGWQKRKALVATKTLNRVKGEADPEMAKKIHDQEREYNKRLIP